MQCLSGGGWRVKLAGGPMADLATTVGFPEGGHEDVSYTPVSQVDGAVDPDACGTNQVADASPRALVTQTVLDGGCGETTTTRYGYAQGKRLSGYRSGQTSLGFRTVTQTNDAAATRVVTTYRQDYPLHGLMEKSYTCAWNGSAEGAKYLERRDNYAYRVILDGARVAFVYLTDSTSRAWDAQSAPWNTKTTYEYGQYGDVWRRTSLGTVDYSGGVASDRYGPDNVIEDTVYVAGSGRYVVKPVRKTISSYDQNNTLGTASKTEYYYDGSQSFGSIVDGLLTMTREHIDSSGAVVETRVQPDAYGNARYIWDGRSNQTALTYDNYNALLLTMTNAEGHVETIGYDAYCRPTSVTDANGNTTTTVYDSFGRVGGRIRPLDTSGSATVRIERSDISSPDAFPRYVLTRRKTIGSAYVDRYDYYDGLGRLLQTKSQGDTSSQWITVDYYHDGAGRNHRVSVPYLSTASTYSERSAEAKLTERQYDPLGRVTITTYPDRTHTQTVYAGAQTTSVDANSHATSATVDVADVRITYEKRYFGTYPSLTLHSTVTTRDYRGEKRVTDAGGHAIYVYTDWLGRKWKYEDPDKGTWYYEYDAASNLTEQTDARGVVTHFTYDQLNRLTLKDYASDPDVHYGYDSGTNGIGRLVDVVWGSGSDHYDFDVRGRVTDVARMLDGRSRSLGYTYDSAERLSTMAYPDGETVSFTYGNRGSLATVVGSSTYVSSMTYDPAGRATSLAYGNGIGTAYDYYDSGSEQDPSSGSTYSYRLRSIDVGPAADPDGVLSLAYGYDPAGNLEQKADGNTPSRSEQYVYDAVDRLTSATGGFGTLTFAYNHYDNIIGKDGQAYTYGTTQPHAVIQKGTGSLTYSYDANGNMISRPGQTITYDNAGRMSAISGNAARSFYYGDGTERTIKADGGRTIYYFFPAYEEEYVAGSLNCTTKYYAANGQVFAQRSSLAALGLRYIHADHLGTWAALTKPDGSVAFSSVYRPYGELAFSTGGPMPRYGFTGQEREGDGLYYYGARYYDPALGRFLQADTVLDGLNRYAYCHNNPVRYTDPTGHDPHTNGGQPITGTVSEDPDLDEQSGEAGVDAGDDGGAGSGGGAGAGETLREAGVALLVGTLAEDVYTGGVGVFDDLITVPAAVAAIIAGTIVMATADDADMPQEPTVSATDKPDGAGATFDATQKQDQRDSEWHYHWDEGAHKTRGDAAHWDRGNLETGAQEWSPDGVHWYPK